MVFEVKEIVNDWNPPFRKSIDVKELTVEEESGFESIPENKEQIFKLIKVYRDQALVEFNRYFTVKGWEHPGNRQVWIKKGDSKSFTYLWGERGITKQLTVKEINGNAE